MLNSVDKKLIKKRFEKNLLTYDENAVVQKHMSEMLLSNLIKFTNNNFDKCLELGCGTGFLTKEILNSINLKELFVNDIVEDSVNQIQKISDKIKNLPGDCEKISFPADLDLVISNATFQWIKDFHLLIDKIHSNLKSSAILAFSTFEEQNLCQIKTIIGKSLNYYTKSEIEDIIGKNFKIIYSQAETFNLEFNSAYEILNHLKLSGVNSLGITKWTKNDLKNFEGKYNELFKNSEGKLVLTYKPLYFICAKIDSRDGEK